MYVETHELSLGSADDTIAQNFKCGEVCCPSGELARVCDEVTTCGDTDLVRVGFLGAIVDDDAGIRYRPVRSGGMAAICL